jgi:hypothetical protein
MAIYTATRCARCQTPLAANDAVTVDERAFCRTCSDIYRMQLRTRSAGRPSVKSDTVNYPVAALGAVLGGAVGTLAWWGVTALTKTGFGALAVVIGLVVGYGTLLFAGGKRSVGLQTLSLLTGIVSFLVAAYLVNMTLLNHLLAERGEAARVAFPPSSVETFYKVVAINFGIMKVAFLGVIAYLAWVVPRPLKLPQP